MKPFVISQQSVRLSLLWTHVTRYNTQSHTQRQTDNIVRCEENDKNSIKTRLIAVQGVMQRCLQWRHLCYHITTVTGISMQSGNPNLISALTLTQLQLCHCKSATVTKNTTHKLIGWFKGLISSKTETPGKLYASLSLKIKIQITCTVYTYKMSFWSIWHRQYLSLS